MQPRRASPRGGSCQMQLLAGSADDGDARPRGGNRQEQQQVLPPRAPQACRHHALPTPAATSGSTPGSPRLRTRGAGAACVRAPPEPHPLPAGPAVVQSARLGQTAATSCRRRPGGRRTPAPGVKPTSAGVTWLRRARRKRPSSVPPLSCCCSGAMPPVCPAAAPAPSAEGAVSHPRWRLPRTSRPAARTPRAASWEHDRYWQDTSPAATRGHRARPGAADRRRTVRRRLGPSRTVPAGPQPGRARPSVVRFAPCSRSHWHSHRLGQTLHILEGTALIACVLIG
jgi:hypothetical protein